MPKNKHFDEIMQSLLETVDVFTSTQQHNKSLLFTNIENQSNLSYQDHDNHCNFSRSGGGHGNVCTSNMEDKVMISGEFDKINLQNDI